MDFIPTYLYIKRHLITGKYYFGKTTKKDPVKYLGSGQHWVPHIKKHGIEHVETIWHELFTNQEDCTEFALFFSEEMDIVKSDKWLNLKPENGVDGTIPGSKLSEAHKAKLSEANKNPSAEVRAKISIASKTRVRTAETCAKISASKLGKKFGPLSDETKAKMSATIKGKKKGPLSAAHRANLSALRKDVKRGPYKTKLRQVNENSSNS